MRSRTIIIAVALAFLGAIVRPGIVGAFDSQALPVLGDGQGEAAAVTGIAVRDRRPTWDVDAHLRLGLTDGLELALPGALALRLISFDEGSAIYAAAGVADLWFDRGGRPLLPWIAALAGQNRFGPEAALLVSFDLVGVERVPFHDEHPLWVRGSAALVIDFGPYLTVAGGIAYQRVAIREAPPAGTRRIGIVGDARFSAGAVRAHPFVETPTLSVHIGRHFDIVALIRVDVDVDRDTTDSRWLIGASFRWDPSLRGEGEIE